MYSALTRRAAADSFNRCSLIQYKIGKIRFYCAIYELMYDLRPNNCGPRRVIDPRDVSRGHVPRAMHNKTEALARVSRETRYFSPLKILYIPIAICVGVCVCVFIFSAPKILLLYTCTGHAPGYERDAVYE